MYQAEVTLSEQGENQQKTTVQVTTTPVADGDKPGKDDMSGSSLGLMAIVIFGLLLVLFVAGVAATGEFATTAAPTPVVGNNVVAPAAVQQLAAPTNTPATATINNGTGATYTVQPGDWLAAIARRYNTTVPAILAANPQITDSNSIQPGVTIVLP